MMFAQCTRKCMSSVLLIALLCCILPPPAQASKVSLASDTSIELSVWYNGNKNGREATVFSGSL